MLMSQLLLCPLFSSQCNNVTLLSESTGIWEVQTETFLFYFENGIARLVKYNGLKICDKILWMVLIPPNDETDNYYYSNL